MNTTNKEIAQNNKIIAEFMGFIPITESDFLADNYKVKKKDILMVIECTKYHSDWNWLMEVVEKIESISFEEDNFINVTIGCGFDCTIQDAHGKLFELSTCEHTKIKTVYNACLEFIKWYNEQKKE